MAQVSAVFKIILDGNGNVTGTGINNPANPEPLAEIDPQNPTMPKNGVRQMAGLAVAGYVGKQAVSYTASRVEMFTGSSQAQNNINMAGKGIGYAAAIIADPVLGIAALALDAITASIDYGFQRKWEDRKLEQLRQRAGYYATDRSRAGL